MISDSLRERDSQLACATVLHHCGQAAGNAEADAVQAVFSQVLRLLKARATDQTLRRHSTGFSYSPFRYSHGCHLFENGLQCFCGRLFAASDGPAGARLPRLVSG